MRRFARYSAFARAAAVAAAAVAFAAGCGRDGAGDGGAASEYAPETYLRDEKFMGELKKLRAERGGLEGARARVVRRMEEMVEAKKKELGTADEAALKAALEKDPEWNSLYSRCVDANKAIGENRRKAAGTVRRRVVPPADGGRGKASK